MSVEPSAGWGVTHLFYRIDRGRLDDPALAGKALARALDDFDHDPYQAIAFSVLGAKADFGVMALGPDLERHDVLRRSLEAAVPVEPVSSYLSITELSEYLSDPTDKMVEDRLHPRLPSRPVIAFYAMSKRRHPDANWYLLPFDERRELMGGHGRVGRKYAGRILQLITASTGLDDFEWGVTLLSDDPAAIKEIVYEMRFDPVSAAYGEFGPFFVGLVLPPADLSTRLGLT